MLNVKIFCTNVVFSSYLYVEKTTFVRKICTYNVDEIDYSPPTALRFHKKVLRLRITFNDKTVNTMAIEFDMLSFD